MRKDTPEYVKDISRKLRKNSTKQEMILWNELRGNKLEGYKFRRQYCIGRYVADFYCSSARLVIEIDGNIHSLREQIEYDNIREGEISARGIRVIRINNNDIEKNLFDVIQRIKKALGEPLS